MKGGEFSFKNKKNISSSQKYQFNTNECIAISWKTSIDEADIKFDDREKQEQAKALYHKNMYLMIKYLNLQGKTFIMKFQRTYWKSQDNISIRVEFGADCWYKGRGIRVAIQEKIYFIMDVCKLLRELSQLNIYRLDLSKDNVVKVKDQYKFIDFEFALLLGKRRIIMNAIGKLEDQLLESSQQVLKFELSQFFSQNNRNCRLYKNFQKIQCKTFKQIMNSNASIDQKIKQGINFFRTHVERLNARHLALLLQSVFSAKQIQEIDSYRRKLSKRFDFCFSKFQDLIKNLRESLDSENITALKEFDTNFRQAKMKPLRRNEAAQENIFLEKTLIDRWKQSYLTLPQQSQAKLAANFQVYKLDLFQIFNYPNSRALEEQYQQHYENFSKKTEGKQYRLQQIIRFLNAKKTYQYLKLELLRYMCKSISINPQKFTRILPIYHPKVTDLNIISYAMTQKWTNCFYKIDKVWRIEEIWQGGLKNVAKFISHIAQGIIQLENQGVYHPQIGFQTITVKEQFRIGKIEKAYLVQSKESLHLFDDLTSTFFYRILEISQTREDQRQQYEQNLYNQIQAHFPDFEHNLLASYIEALSPMDNYIYDEAEIMKKKVEVLRQYIRKNYQRYHALRFGDMLRQLLQYGMDKSANKNSSVPQYEQENYKRVLLLVEKLHNQNQTSNSSFNVRAFIALFTKIYPFCERHPQQLVVYSFQQESSEEKRVCDECLLEIIDQSAMPKLLCLYHRKIIEYIETNKDTMRLMTKRYFCEGCLPLLETSNRFKIIDAQDLQPGEYLCMNLGCSENLISRQNRDRNHAGHPSQKVQKISELCSNLQTIESASFGSQMGRVYQAIKEKLSSSVKLHFEAIDNIYLTLIKFNKNSEFLQNTLSQGKNFMKFNQAQATLSKKFFKLAKIFVSLQGANQKEKRGKSQLLTCFAEYLLETYRTLADQVYQGINSILKDATNELEQQIFKKDPKQLEQSLLELVRNKYKTVVNNEEEKVCQPAPILEIPNVRNKLVESVTIVQPQSDLQTFQNLRYKFLSVVEQGSKKQIHVLQNMAQIIKKEDLYSQLFGFRRKYDKYFNIAKGSFLKEGIKLRNLQGRFTLVKYQKLNRKALYTKIFSIQATFQKFKFTFQKINEMIEFKINYDPENNKEKQIEDWGNYKKQLIQNINYLAKKINLQDQKYCCQIRALPLNLHQSLTNKIINMPNLKELSLITYPNYSNHLIHIELHREYLMSGPLLKKIYENCKNLQRLYLKGGDIEIRECLQATMELNNRETFQLYLHSANAVSELQQFKVISKLVSKKFKVPSLRIRLNKQMTEKEKSYILKILDKLSELQLEVEGPIVENGNVFEVLNYILNRQSLTLKTLLLQRVELEEFHGLLKELSGKSQLSEVVLLHCINYPRTVFFENQGDHLTYLFVKGENPKAENSQAQIQMMTMPSEFLEGLLQFPRLKALKLNNLDTTGWQRISFSLSHLNQLRLLSLRYCLWFDHDFLGSLPQQTLSQIETLDLQACMQLKRELLGFVQPIQKMKKLRYINISQTQIGMNELLNFQSEKLKVLKFRGQQNFNGDLQSGKKIKPTG